LIILVSCALGQTYEINDQNSSKTSGQKQKSSSNDNSQNLGWGSSIEVSRQARAAQDALKRNDYAAAVSFAERAAKSAPQNADLWFLLGYAARLSERYPLSVDAFNRGLTRRRNSCCGASSKQIPRMRTVCS